MSSAPAAESPARSLRWEIDVPILTHPLMIAGFLKAFALAGLLMWALVSFVFVMQGEYRLVGQMALLTGVVLTGVVIIGALGTLVVYRNRIHMRFTLDEEAATSETLDARVRRVNRLAIWLGLLAGKPGAVGAGLIGQSTATTRVAWSSVAFMRAYPRWSVIALGNNWRTTMLVFCPPRQYAAALAHVAAARRAHPARARRNPVPGLLARTALIVLACVPLFNLPVKIDLFTPFFVLCFALAALWLIPVLAWAVFGGLAWIAGEAWMASVAPFRSIFTRQMTPRYEVFSGDDYAMFALALAGAAFLVWLSVGLIAGRVPTALAGDLNEMDEG